MRLDQWLWAVRLFKSRSLAAEAIKGGRAKVNGAATKPAHEARPGEIVTITYFSITRTARVLGAPRSRVAAKLVAEYAEDLTPPEEYERQRAHRDAPGLREAGAGRPTKKDRRELDALNDLPEDPEPPFGHFF
jgi:ribosome-associated heat shock protein Hsp15